MNISCFKHKIFNESGKDLFIYFWMKVISAKMKYGHFSVQVKPAFSRILFKNKSWEGVR